MANTLNYGWTKPTVGGDTNAWGTELNTLFDAADASLKTINNEADAALPKAGGTMTGRLDAKTTTLVGNALGNVSGNPVNLDCSVGQAVSATLIGTATFAFTNVPAGVSGLLLKLTNGAAFAITWPGSVKWPSGAPPALTAAGVDMIAFLTYDGGTTWQGYLVAKDLR
jgi:hypothetical protein